MPPGTILSTGINFGHMLAFPELTVQPGREFSSSYKAHPSIPNAHERRSPLNGSSLHPPPSPPDPRVGLGGPTLHPCILDERRSEGVVEAKCRGEAGSAPIWRAAVAGKQGAEGTETCVTSFSLLPLLPSPTGPCSSLRGGTRTPAPDEGGDERTRAKDEETSGRGTLLPVEGSRTPILSRRIAPQMGMGERSP